MASWLIFWSSPIFLYFPSFLVSEVYWEGILNLPRQNPPHMNTCYSWAWGLIYGLKSMGVQFLTAQADNGRDWMKQFVTSSLPLTFTGCWLIGPRGALLGIDVRRWSYWYGFFSIDSKCKLTIRYIGGGEKRLLCHQHIVIFVETGYLPNVINAQRYVKGHLKDLRLWKSCFSEISPKD